VVRGLPAFRAHFADFQNHYVLIGGSACDIQMEQAGLDFRATKDLDLVLCVEALDGDFVAAFWQFVKAGGYQQREKSDGKKEFFRFLKPTNEEYPAQLELFSRALSYLPVADGVHLTPIPTHAEADSLSAILLDENYYACLHEGAVVIEDVSVLKPEYLLVFKAKAYLDLVEKKKKGLTVRSDDIKKHRLDVFRVFQLLSLELRVQLAEPVRIDLENFVEAMRSDQPDIKAIGIKTMTAEEVLDNIISVYALKVKGDGAN